MVSRFYRAAPLHVIARPYAGPLIRLLPLEGGDVRLTTAALESVGEVCKVLRQDVAPFSDHLMSIIIANMQGTFKSTQLN